MIKRCLQTATLTVALGTGAALANENVMVVFDGSNSMWGQIDGTAKIEIARGVMDNLLGDWVEERNVGLMAYGHRTRGDCSDIELLVEPGAQSRQSILDQINAITPTGKTPLTDAVEQAAKALSYTDQPATVVLISDGLESCGRDPCALAAALEKGGVGFTAHVVGFGLANDEDAASLACIAEETGGQYISARDATELGDALSTVGSAVARAEPVAPVEPPEPATPEVIVTAPDTAVGGSVVTVTWESTIEEADYITIVPAGSDPDEFGTYQRIGKADEVTIPVSGEAGLYEVRYLHNATKEVKGFANLDVTKPEVTLTAPDTAETGSQIPVTWEPTINKVDYVAVVPLGADEGAFGNYQQVRDTGKANLRAPADPGLYEVRYILNVDKRTVTSRQIEISDVQIALTVPETALTGESFKVGWSMAVDKSDYINIVPAGADEGEFGNYILVRDGLEGTVKAPADPGLYEVRYVLREGSKTLAIAPIEIIAPTVTISGPEKVVTGAQFEVSWTGAIDKGDYAAIVPAGSPDGTFGNYTPVRDNSSDKLTAPADPGLYELRYILREGSKTLATAAIEVTTPEVTISAPESALAGAKIPVSWTGAISKNDYINIVPLGADEGTYGNYFPVRDDSSGNAQAPGDPGMYEIRYTLREGSKTVTSVMLEITEPEVTVSAPSEIRAGDKLRVTWTGTVNGGDYINLVPMGTEDGTYGTYSTVRDRGTYDFNAPKETGLYEVRYQLRENARVLARATVEVLPEDAALDTGASITAPDTAAAGSTIEVGWNIDSESADQRLTVARADQAIFTWISAEKITGAPPMQITLPAEPGTYELRVLDLPGKAVLSRKVITVE